MVALPEPVEHDTIFPFPLTALKHGRMVTAIGLPPGIPRQVSRWHACWFAAVRKRGGPWFEVRLARGDWEKCRIQAKGASLVMSRRDHRRALRSGRKIPRSVHTGWLVKIRDATKFADPELVGLVQRSIAAPRMVSNAAGDTKVWDVAGGPGAWLEKWGVEVERPN